MRLQRVNVLLASDVSVAVDHVTVETMVHPGHHPADKSVAAEEAANVPD